MPRAKQMSKARDSVENIQDDLKNLRDDVTQLSQQLETLLRDTGGDVADDVKKRLVRAKATVDEMLETAGVKGLEAARAANDMKDNLVEGVEETVREHPMMTLAIAVGVGFIVSSALRR